MRVYFKLKNGDEYMFKNVVTLRQKASEKLNVEYLVLGVIDTIKKAYGEIERLELGNIRII